MRLTKLFFERFYWSDYSSSIEISGTSFFVALLTYIRDFFTRNHSRLSYPFSRYRRSYTN